MSGVVPAVQPGPLAQRADLLAFDQLVDGRLNRLLKASSVISGSLALVSLHIAGLLLVTWPECARHRIKDSRDDFDASFDYLFVSWEISRFEIVFLIPSGLKREVKSLVLTQNIRAVILLESP
jgi:hypothetical protein